MVDKFLMMTKPIARITDDELVLFVAHLREEVSQLRQQHRASGRQTRRLQRLVSEGLLRSYHRGRGFKVPSVSKSVPEPLNPEPPIPAPDASTTEPAYANDPRDWRNRKDLQ